MHNCIILLDNFNSKTFYTSREHMIQKFRLFRNAYSIIHKFRLFRNVYPIVLTSCSTAEKCTYKINPKRVIKMEKLTKENIDI